MTITYFKDAPHAPKLEDDLSEHVRFFWETIFQYPYPNGLERDETHHIQHAVRAMMAGTALWNLSVYYDPKRAAQLARDVGLTPTEENQKLVFKLCQIYLLLHDAGREAGGTDLWDRDSAETFYRYATHVLNIDKELARKIAEFGANKDTEQGYYHLILDENDQITWHKSEQPPPRTAQQDFIQGGDCLDIIRVYGLDSFQPEKLNAHGHLIATNNNSAEIMLYRLIREQAALIAVGGEPSYSHSNEDKQKERIGPECYKKIQKDIASRSDFLPLLAQLTSGYLPPARFPKKLIPVSKPYDPATGATEANMNAALQAGELHARGIAGLKIDTERKTKKGEQKPAEASIELELRKTYRIEDAPTKSGKLGKKGNRNRSTTMLYHTDLYKDVGFLALGITKTELSQVNQTNAATGFGKKDKKYPFMSQEQAKQALANLLHHKQCSVKTNHNELLSLVTHYDAIYFYSRKGRDEVPYKAILEAIFLQGVAKKYGKDYPIFEYSLLYNRVSAQTYTWEETQQLWQKAVEITVITTIRNNQPLGSVEEIKIQAISGANASAVSFMSADFYYTDAEKTALNKMIETCRDQAIEKYNQVVWDNLKNNHIAIYAPECVRLLENTQKLTAEQCDIVLQAAKKAMNRYKIIWENEHAGLGNVMYKGFATPYTAILKIIDRFALDKSFHAPAVAAYADVCQFGDITDHLEILQLYKKIGLWENHKAPIQSALTHALLAHFFTQSKNFSDFFQGFAALIKEAELTDTLVSSLQPCMTLAWEQLPNNPAIIGTKVGLQKLLSLAPNAITREQKNIFSKACFSYFATKATNGEVLVHRANELGGNALDHLRLLIQAMTQFDLLDTCGRELANSHSLTCQKKNTVTHEDVEICKKLGAWDAHQKTFQDILLAQLCDNSLPDPTLLKTAGLLGENSRGFITWLQHHQWPQEKMTCTYVDPFLKNLFDIHTFMRKENDPQAESIQKTIITLIENLVLYGDVQQKMFPLELTLSRIYPNLGTENTWDTFLQKIPTLIDPNEKNADPWSVIKKVMGIVGIARSCGETLVSQKRCDEKLHTTLVALHQRIRATFPDNILAPVYLMTTQAKGDLLYNALPFSLLLKDTTDYVKTLTQVEHIKQLQEKLLPKFPEAEQKALNKICRNKIADLHNAPRIEEWKRHQRSGSVGNMLETSRPSAATFTQRVRSRSVGGEFRAAF